MVTHVSFALDDQVAERAKQVKDDHGWSWAELMEQAVEEFEDAD